MNVFVDVKDPLPHFYGKRFMQHEHGIYNEKGIPALTISAKKDMYISRTDKYSVFDNAISNDDLKRNILIISEALVKVIYSFTDKSVNFFLENDSLLNETSIDQVKDFLLKNPRAPHMIQRNSPISKEF